MSSSHPIGKQIASISLVLIAGLTLLSIFAIATTLLIRSTFLEYRETALETLAAASVSEEFYEARMAALKWRLTPNEEIVKSFQRNMEELAIAEASLEEVGGDNSQLVKSFANLKTELADYGSHFDKMLSSRAQFDAVKADIGKMGLEARKALTSIMTTAYEDNDPIAAFYAGRAQESLMLARYYLERYRQTEASNDLGRAMTEMQESVGEIKILKTELQNPTRISHAENAFEAINGLITRSQELSGIVDARKAARAALDSLGPKVMQDVETVIQTATDRQSTLGPRGQAISFWSVIAICIAAFATILLGWRISKTLSNRISRDIEGSVETMTRIAEGDLDAEVRNSELDNEIGRMARALDVFKTNGKAAIDAAEREKAAESERLRLEEERQRQQEEQEAAARARAEAERKTMIQDLSSSVGEVVSAASDGDFSQRVNADFDDDELAALAQGVNTLVQSVDNGVSATQEVMEAIARGDLTHQMNGTFKGAFKELQNNTNFMIDALKSLVGEISGSGVNLASSSTELKDTSASLSKQAEQNAASLEETSAALEELTASINQVSSNISDANEHTRLASETAKSSSVVAASAAEAMNRISEASSEIAKVVSVINEIAFQINLLALNAGVEAARAGDAGRGFSVVASEVRQLAQRASDAAKEIDEVIVRSDQAVTEGVSKVTDAQTSLHQIAESVVGVAQRIEEISGAISEQVHGIGEINNAVAKIDRNTQRQAASFEEVTAASSLLSNEADGLKQSTNRFNIGDMLVDMSPRNKPKVEPEIRRKVAAPVSGNLALDQGWDEF